MQERVGLQTNPIAPTAMHKPSDGEAAVPVQGILHCIPFSESGGVVLE